MLPDLLTQIFLVLMMNLKHQIFSLLLLCMTLKNFYGFLGGRRNVFHQDINGIITELSQLLKPSLCVLDGTVSMMTNGPTGGSLSDLKDTGTMVVSTDPVAADAVGVELLGRTLADVPYILMAEKAGAGIADYHRLNPVLLTTVT